MKLDWVVMAEGLGQGSRGDFAMIGVDQNLVVVSKVPTTTKRAVLGRVSFDADEAKPGDSLRFAVRVVGPGEKVVAAAGGATTFAQLPYPDLPGIFHIPFEGILSLEDYGEYRIVIEVTAPDGSQLEGSTSLWVHRPPESLAE